MRSNLIGDDSCVGEGRISSEPASLGRWGQPGIVFVTDANQVPCVNAASTAMTGYANQEAVGCAAGILNLEEHGVLRTDLENHPVRAGLAR